jgi:hypothetical protein
VSTWERIESTGRSVALTGGLEARVADPLWMLARQWQVSEFRGDDAAQPAAVRLTGRSARLTGLQGISGPSFPFPHSVPLEAVIERASPPDFGAASLFAAARASRRLVRLLTTAGLVAAIDTLRTAFPLTFPDRLVTFGSAGAHTAALLAQRSFDCAALAGADAVRLERVLVRAVRPSDWARAIAVINDWRSWYARLEGPRQDLAWDGERLEHAFSLSAGGPAPDQITVQLNAPEHDGGLLDWHTFDIVSNSAARPPDVPTRTVTALVTPVRFHGMPASRWWQFEDGTVNFGDIDAGPADLARLIVAEFATAYSDDWFVVPIKVPVGSISELTRLEVIDTFGGRTRIQSTAESDAVRTGGKRVWRLFELTGDEVNSEHPAPWLLVVPTLAGVINGPILERVLLARDEGANLAWAIERQVEGPLGRGVDRAEAWHAAYAATQSEATADSGRHGHAPDAADPLTYSEQSWRYRLEASAPPWWIPFVAERVAPDSAEVRLRRARMGEWDLHQKTDAISHVGPQGVFLDPRHPRWLYEEEVPRGGVRIERRWQFGRWHDGSFHVWLQRRKHAGHGERSSGVRWDLLTRS